MRNLKKFLALVLAMVMAFSLMLTANAIDYSEYTDKDAVTEEFEEAVAVLSGLKIMEGDGPEDAKTFRPGDTITRAEAAAVIYRIATGDVDNTQVNIYADYGTFTDVKSDDWFAGYVGYCQNAGYIKGHANRFSPYGKVTGYEMLAMILRVVGYGKNNEFTGTQWQVNVASLSKQLGVTDNVKNANFETTLNFAARRDVVADLMFQTMVNVPTVTYTPSLAYNDKTTLAGTEFNPTLGQKTFGLWQAIPGVNAEGENAVVDMWGRPGYFWVKGGSRRYEGADHKPVYNGSLGNQTARFTYSNVVATITEKPAITWTETKRECDLAHEFPFTNSRTFSLYVNYHEPITENYLVVATDTVTRVGGQGRLTEVYKSVSGVHSDDRVVMVDTYLTRVNKVTNAILDPAGHIITPSYMDVTVYDVDGNNGTAKTISKPSTDDSNWEYAAGDYLLINAWTDWTEGDEIETQRIIDDTSHADHDTDQVNPDTLNALNHDPVIYNGAGGHGATVTAADKIEANNKAAFEANRTYTYWNNPAGDDNMTISNSLTSGSNVVVLGKAASKVAKQTVTYWNQAKHQVDGTDTPDAMLLKLDEAGTTTSRDFTWFYDQYNNIIGIVGMGTVQYGVITSIWASFGQGDSSTDGTAKVYAKVKMADNTETTLEISRFLVSESSDDYDEFKGHTTQGAPSGYNQPISDTLHSADLVPVYDYNVTGGTVMRASDRTGTSTLAAMTGNLHVAPVASINTAEDLNRFDDGDGEYGYGIVKGNMFKFETDANGTSYTAIEVAGKGAANGGKFVNLNNAVVDTTDLNAKLYKRFGYITLNDTAAGPGAPTVTVWVDNSTKIIVRDAATGTVTAYDGVNALPSDVTLARSAGSGTYHEVDWVDVNNDSRAEYVYVTGTVTGSVTYGLFYYNGGASQWNGAEGTGTMRGFLNGEETTITFDDEDDFNILNGSQAYAGHLFALQFVDNVVSSVMGLTGDVEEILSTMGTLVDDFDSNIKTLPFAGNFPGAVAFIEGTEGGNPYTDNTEAIYVYDENVTNNAAKYDVSYNRNTRKVTTNNNGTILDYTIVDSTKIIGMGNGVVLATGEAVLSYLDGRNNDVTIVYERNSIRSINEIYIATDPNVTPGTQGGAYSATISRDGGTPSVLDANVSHSGTGGYTGDVDIQVFAHGIHEGSSDFRLIDTISGLPMTSGTLDTNPATGIVSGARADTVYTFRVVISGTNTVIATASNSIVGTRN